MRFEPDRYTTLTAVQQDLNRGRTYMYKWLKDLEACGRYPPEAVIREGQRKYIHKEVVTDFITYRDKIHKGFLIPPFREGRSH